MNTGAALVSNISSATPIVVTTANAHNFVTGTNIVINVPISNGLQPVAIPSWQMNPQLFVGPIIVTAANTFTMDFDCDNFTNYAAAFPVYAVPVTYSCSAIPNNLATYQPAYRIMIAITNGLPAQITTSFNHGYQTGLVVRLNVPPGCGMSEINQLTATITVTGLNTFTVPIDTTYFTPFGIPSPTSSSNPAVNVCALVVPIGEDNSILYQATQNVLPY